MCMPPKTTVVFAADSRERSLRALLLQDALLRRGFDCLASEIRIEPASVRETEAEDFPNQEQIRWGGNLFRRFCNMFSENTLSLLGQHASCSTAQQPVELSENSLQNLFYKLPPQSVHR